MRLTFKEEMDNLLRFTILRTLAPSANSKLVSLETSQPLPTAFSLLPELHTWLLRTAAWYLSHPTAIPIDESSFLFFFSQLEKK